MTHHADFPAASFTVETFRSWMRATPERRLAEALKARSADHTRILATLASRTAIIIGGEGGEAVRGVPGPANAVTVYFRSDEESVRQAFHPEGWGRTPDWSGAGVSLAATDPQAFDDLMVASDLEVLGGQPLYLAPFAKLMKANRERRWIYAYRRDTEMLQHLDQRHADLQYVEMLTELTRDVRLDGLTG